MVGDVVGVAQGNGVAFGIQALNIKTNAGIPEEYGQLVTQTYGYTGKAAELSVASIPDYKLAAADISDGTVFHFSARRRNKQDYRQVQGLNNSLVLPVEGADGLIKGAKIAFFGSKIQKLLPVSEKSNWSKACHIPCSTANGAKPPVLP